MNNYYFNFEENGKEGKYKTEAATFMQAYEEFREKHPAAKIKVGKNFDPCNKIFPNYIPKLSPSKRRHV